VRSSRPYARYRTEMYHLISLERGHRRPWNSTATEGRLWRFELSPFNNLGMDAEL
jgi:hypothetical protein